VAKHDATDGGRRGLKRLRSATVIACGHAFVQNLLRGHYEIATDVSAPLRLAAAFTSSHRSSDNDRNRPFDCLLRLDATEPLRPLLDPHGQVVPVVRI